MKNVANKSKKFILGISRTEEGAKRKLFITPVLGELPFMGYKGLFFVLFVLLDKHKLL